MLLLNFWVAEMFLLIFFLKCTHVNYIMYSIMLITSLAPGQFDCGLNV